ncbi:MAG: hypothetical protein ACR2NN_29045 [Bryobacteraceae bacterium]
MSTDNQGLGVVRTVHPGNQFLVPSGVNEKQVARDTTIQITAEEKATLDALELEITRTSAAFKASQLAWSRYLHGVLVTHGAPTAADGHQNSNGEYLWGAETRGTDDPEVCLLDVDLGPPF